MTIQEALRKYSKIEIDLLLSHVLGTSKEFLYLRPETKLSSKHLKILAKLVKHRLRGEPMAYILGYKDFYGLRIKVSRDVLIPRPETEELVEMTLEYLKNSKLKAKSLKLLDLGAGSGCVIISLAKTLLTRMTLALRKGHPCDWKFCASDISSKALAIARQNAKTILNKYFNTSKYGGIRGNSKPIKFVRSDLFDKIKGKFDVVIANLPYVTKKDYESRIKNLGWEPKIALTDGTGRWELYEKFFKQIPRHLEPKAEIFLEIDPKSLQKIRAWTKKYLPAAKIVFTKNLAGRFRFARIST